MPERSVAICCNAASDEVDHHAEPFLLFRAAVLFADWTLRHCRKTVQSSGVVRLCSVAFPDCFFYTVILMPSALIAPALFWNHLIQALLPMAVLLFGVTFWIGRCSIGACHG